MRNKTISLCPTSYELAQKMPNFSNWVRKQLLDRDKEHQNARNEAKRYRCPACFKVYRELGEGKQWCLNRDCGYTKEMELFE